MKTNRIFTLLLAFTVICSAAPSPKGNPPHPAKHEASPQHPVEPEAKEPFILGGEHGLQAPGRPERTPGPDVHPGPGPDVHPVHPAPDVHPSHPAPGHKMAAQPQSPHFVGHPPKPLPPKPPKKSLHVRIPKPIGSTTPDGWFDDWNAACKEARRLDRPMLVLFTGSDWCHWCKVLHKEVLNTFHFRNFAVQKLILVYMDEPSKVKLPSQLRHTREELAQMLHVGNGVPCTILLSPEGHRWDDIGGYDKDYLEIVRKILQRHGY